MKILIIVLLSISLGYGGYDGDTSFKPKSPKPAFTKNHTTLCFDTGHENLAVDEGFYEPVLGLMESDGLKVIRKKERFVQKALKECNILYISAVHGHKNHADKKLAARSAFDEEEIKDITNWVKEGGGLLLATDHKPMGEAAAKLLAQFEIAGSSVHVWNPKNKIKPFKEHGIFSIPKVQMNMKSPIVMGRNVSERLKLIYTFYGQGLTGPKDADLFLHAGEDAKIGGEYGEEVIAFEKFPAVGIAGEFGKGRVVAFGDATVFTSKMDTTLKEKTGINRAGSDNVQMALNVVRWLGKVLN